MENRKISISDIAKLSGVSVATVSRIINKTGRYSKETEIRVLDIIKENNYKQNLNAKSLRTNISQSIGVIVPDLANEFFAKIIQSIQATAIKSNYSVFVCDSNESVEQENLLINNLESKNVDGIIYISGKLDVKRDDEKYGIPVIYIDRSPKHADVLIQSHNEHGGKLATKELIEKGCTAIAMLRDDRMISCTNQRYDGYIKSHREKEMDINPNLVIDIKPTYKSAKEATINLINSGTKFDGIFALNDMTALGALHALQENNISVPHDVKIVGFDGVSAGEFCSPALTTVRQDTELMGQIAMETMIKMIKGEEIDEKSIKVPVELIRRETT